MVADRPTAAASCPPLTIRIDLTPGQAIDESHFKSLPAKPGVLAIEDDLGGTLALITTANLRRAALARLGELPEDQARSPRVNLRPVARRILATTVGSAFEADWAYLQLARQRLPYSYRALADRWQAWFICCDAGERFPQWVKTNHPSMGPAAPGGRGGGTCVGPFADKHAAHRFIEMLEDAFDLCRYHHILVQAPHAAACAYKEMGRCPAPCDGTVSLERYRQQVRDSIEFARAPASARQQLESRMNACSAAMDFEGAARCRTLLDRTAIAARSEFAQVRDLPSFRFIAVMPAERTGWARLVLIDGGWIVPLVDVRVKQDDLRVVHDVLARWMIDRREWEFGDDTLSENVGMVCRHLLRPRARTKARLGEFLHATQQGVDPDALAAAIARVGKRMPAHQSDQSGAEELVEQELERL